MKPPRRTNRSNKSVAEYFKRNTDTEDTPPATTSGSSSKREIWSRPELQLILRGLRKQVKVTACQDINLEELQRDHVPERSVQQIDSMLGTLKRTIARKAFNQARYQLMKDHHKRAPIQMWAELMERMAGGHEENISAAFSRMLVIAGTEPLSLRFSVPARPFDSPSSALSTAAPPNTQPPSQTAAVSNHTASRPDKDHVISRPSPSPHVPTVPMASSTLLASTPFLSTALPLSQVQGVILPMQLAGTQKCSESSPALPREAQHPSHTATGSNTTTGPSPSSTGPSPSSHVPHVVMVPGSSATMPGVKSLPSAAQQVTPAISTAPPPPGAQPPSQTAAVSNSATSGPDKGHVTSRPSPSPQIPAVAMIPVAPGASPCAAPPLPPLPKLTPAPGVILTPPSPGTQPPPLSSTTDVSNHSVASCPDKDGPVSTASQSSHVSTVAMIPVASSMSSGATPLPYPAVQVNPMPGGPIVPPQLPLVQRTASAPPSLLYSSELHSQVLNPISCEEYDIDNTIDFERVYSYLSAVSKGVSDCEGQLTPMECAVVLDLIMCLPEELPLLDCEGLRDHFLEMYSRLYSPAQMPINKQATLATGQGASQTDQSAEPTDSSVLNDKATADPKAPSVQETWESIGISPLNPLMVPLSLLGRKEKR